MRLSLFSPIFKYQAIFSPSAHLQDNSISTEPISIKVRLTSSSKIEQNRTNGVGGDWGQSVKNGRNRVPNVLLSFSEILCLRVVIFGVWIQRTNGTKFCLLIRHFWNTLWLTEPHPSLAADHGMGKRIYVFA